MENDVIGSIGEQIPDLKQSIYPVYSTNVEKPCPRTPCTACTKASVSEPFFPAAVSPQPLTLLEPRCLRRHFIL